jgi:hypothetical protein
MDIRSIANPLAFALFTASGSRLDDRVGFGPPREVALGPSRRPTAGFRRLRWRAQLHQKRRNHSMDPNRRQPTRIVTALPRQTKVRNICAPVLALIIHERLRSLLKVRAMNFVPDVPRPDAAGSW